MLGFFISGHPLEKYADKLEDLHALSTAALNAMKRSMAKGEEIFAAGVLGGVRVLKSKRGDLYANAALEDMEGRIDAMIFPEAFRRLGEKVKLEVPVLVKGSVRVEEGAAAKLAISEITPLEEAKPKLAKALRLRISLAEAIRRDRRRAARHFCEIARGGQGDVRSGVAGRVRGRDGGRRL